MPNYSREPMTEAEYHDGLLQSLADGHTTSETYRMLAEIEGIDDD